MENGELKKQKAEGRMEKGELTEGICKCIRGFLDG
jgi:hypothetical protein